MMYHPLKIGCEKISSSVDMVETVISDYMSPQCDLDLEDSKPVFLHDTLAHDYASPYQVWLQKVQQVRKCHPDEHSLKFWTFSVDHFALAYNRAIQSFHKTIQLMMMCHQTKFSCKRIRSSEDTLESHILIIWSFTVTLKTANQSSAWHPGLWWCITIPSLVTKGSAVEGILSRWTFTGILNIFCDIDLDHNRAIQSFHKTIHLMMMYNQT